MINLLYRPAATQRSCSGVVLWTCAALSRRFFEKVPDDLSGPCLIGNRRSCPTHRNRSSPNAFIGDPDPGFKKKRGIHPLYLFAVLCTLFFTNSAFSSETVINTARADYSIGTVPMVSYSSAVSLIVRTSSTLEYLEYAPLSPDLERLNVSTTKYLDSSGSPVAMSGPVALGTKSSLDISNLIPLIKANVYHVNEPLFLRLADGDQNIDPTVAETILLTLEIKDNSEKEVFVFTETGPDTGVFIGYVNTAVTASVVNGDGVLSVNEDASIVAAYVDSKDSADTAEATVLIDPFGIVFDSRTGLPVDGITVNMIDTSTGNPAVVYGDDGVSIYPSTVISGGTVADSSGVVYTFDPGGYRFPFVQLGKYRLAVTPSPAYRAPSTVPTAELLALGPFAIAPGSRGEEFVVAAGPALHIDIPIDPILTALYLTKAAAKDTVAIGDFLQYRITVENADNVNIAGILVSDRLPLGFRYRPGSTKISGAAAPDPAVSTDGRTLTFNLGSLASGKTADITYVVEIAAGAKTGKAMNLATATGNNGLAVSNTVGAEVLVKEDLFGSRTIIMGRVFPGCENQSPLQASVAEGSGGLNNNDGVAGVRIYLEDGTYAVTDKKGMYHFEGLKPGTHIVQLDLDTMPGDYELIACEENDRFAGTPYSQFVDLQGGTMWRADFYAIRRPAAPPVETEESAGTGQITEDEKRMKAGTMPEFDSAWLGRAEPGLAFVWPGDGFHPAIPSVKIAVKHDPGKKLRLLLNGDEVDPIYLDGTTKRGDNQIAVSLWLGIHVQDGDNLFTAVEYGQDGSEEKRTVRAIHYSGPPIKVQLVPEQSRFTADGRTPAVIAVRLTDKDGHPAREGVIGEYKVDPPYLPLQKSEDLQHDPLSMSKSERLNYVVGEDGIALIELQPTSHTGEATLRFNLVSGENEVHPWLIPGERDWIIVGLAEGTAGYNTVAGNMESLGDSAVDDKYYKDGRLAFFAKGMIKGKWLLTVSYDSDKNGNAEKNDSLHQIIDPDKYYTLYGDATQQGYEAASARSLYVKLERDKFYALFGDFETGLKVTELSRYSRNLNGLKSEMKGERFDFSVFASDTNQAFVKDEIRGDGSSGLYLLSRKNIVMNSESVTIETRDRFHSEAVISSWKLSRHIDYSIDYETGSIYFKSPVYSRDENFNPIHIVVDYESFDTTDMSYNYGGRGAVRFMDNRLELGATHVHEGSVGGEGNLDGIDVTVKINDQTSIRTELAVTNTDLQGSGRAYIAELSHRAEKLAGKVYVREQDEEFGLGQQRGSETGTRKLGFDGTYRLNEKVSFKSDAYRQYNLSVDAVRDMAEAQVQYAGKKYDLHGGLRHAADNLGNGEVNTSEQLTAGGSLRLMGDRLALMLDHDQSLWGNANSDFPTRTTLGADYKLNDTAALFAAQEFTRGENEDTATSRMGMRASPWSGGQISTSVGQQYSENGARVFAVAGLQQSYKINDRWSMDAGMDRSVNLKHPGNNQFNLNVPASSGGENFTAFSLGTAYKEKKWSWTARIETRTSDDEDRIGVFSGVYGEVEEGIGLAAALQAFRTEYSSGAVKESGDLRFGLAYRPKRTSWIILDRLDFLVDKQNGAAGFDFDNRRIINNMNANYKLSNKTQLSLQYGFKYVRETIDSNDYSGYTDLTGLEGRHDVTKKWDIGLRGNVLHSWSADQLKYGIGASVGYSFVKNVWLSVGYNFTGFRDRDFSRADFTAQGFFVKLRMKFDQGSVRDAVKHFTGQ